jgi:TrmH family RNA methyltransferase
VTPANDDVVERFARARDDETLAVLEGFHAVKHALRFGADLVVIVTRDPEALAGMARELAPDMAVSLGAARVVASDVFERLGPRPHPTGVAGIARRPQVDLAALLGDPTEAPVVVLEEPRRPENLGAAIRVAAAAGAAGVIAVGGVDPWHPAALRGGAGLHFAIAVGSLRSLDELLEARGRVEPSFGTPLTSRPLVALDPAGEPLVAGAIPTRALLAFGTERLGLGANLLARADRRLAIPMRAGVSSLNLATAVAVTLYAWRWGRGLLARR